MKRLKFIFLYLSFGLSFLNSPGQQIGNYVANGGFEENYTCQGPLFPLTTAKYWLAIDSVSYGGDYDNLCNGKVPLNGNTFQFPRSGRSYVLSTQYYLSGGRGYLKNRLKSNLKTGTSYCVKYYVNIANTSPRGMDGFGAYFGDNSIDTIKVCTIPLTYLSPQVKNPIGNVITDTLNWVAITGTFVATGNEKYLVLGNFLADNAVTTASINTPSFPENWTDVCFDDVSCIEIGVLAFAGPDKFIYPSDSTFIGRQPDFAIDPGCRWYRLPNMTTAFDTISGLWVKPSSTSTYVVRQELDCSPLKWDTVVVTVSHNLIGLNDLQRLSDNITLFPNPTSGNLSISFSGSAPSDIGSYFITDNLGQNIREEDLHGSSISVSTSDLAPGLYQIHLRTPFGTVTKKFVKAD